MFASICLGLTAALLAFGNASAAEPLTIYIQYIEREVARPPTLSSLDPIELDVGVQGATLAVADSNTTGKFLGQVYELSELFIGKDDDLLAAVQSGDVGDLVVAHLPQSDLIALADARPDTLIFNVSAADMPLRGEACRANMLHTIPSHAMLSDALAQFLLKKQWTDWLLLTGPSEPDHAFGNALRNSAKKFGNKIVEDIDWSSQTDLQRDAYEEVPRLTNGKDHDIVVVADTVGDFARYLPYNTYRSRPVAGSEGLVPTGWSRVVEQWGAAQLQRRFIEQAERPMRAVDYAAWAAVRSIAESVSRTGKSDAASVRSYLLSDKFQLAAFKGRKMSYRKWNGQLRQPIPLVHPRALVALAPIEGFLHPVTELDTLGLERNQSKCEGFDE